MVVPYRIFLDGKVRGRISIPAKATQDEALAAAKADPHVRTHIDGKTLKKEIYVPGKLVNLVAI